MTAEGVSAHTSELGRLRSRILTPKQQVEHPAAHIDEPRYVVRVKNGDTVVTYFGAKHTNNPKDPIFEEIQAAFEETQPDIVYFEGWAQANTHKEQVREYIQNLTLEQAKQEGESIFTLKLAIDAGIAFESPEPPEDEEYQYLLSQGFSVRDQFFQMFYRIMHQYLREHADPSLDECRKYIGRYFDRFRQISDAPVEDLDALEDEALASIDLDAEQFYSDNCDPVPWEDKENTRSKQVSAAATIYRDRYALERYAAGLNQHKRLFMTYGRNHAIALEPALKALVEKS